MNNNHNQTIGKLGEAAARNLYKENGFQILIENFFNRSGRKIGEIDFAAFKRGHLHFVEVKARTNNRFGSPEEAITEFKRQRLLAAIRLFFTCFPSFDIYKKHIDVACVDVDPFDKSIQKIRIHSDAIEDNY